MALKCGLEQAPTNSEKATKVKVVGIKCWIVFPVEKGLSLIWSSLKTVCLSTFGTNHV